MKTQIKKTCAFFGAAGIALTLAACDVDQTDEGALPDVSVEGGDLPEYDVEPADVNVSTGTETVEVPTMDVDVATDDAAGEPVTEGGE